MSDSQFLLLIGTIYLCGGIDSKIQRTFATIIGLVFCILGGLS